MTAHPAHLPAVHLQAAQIPAVLLHNNHNELILGNKRQGGLSGLSCQMCIAGESSREDFVLLYPNAIRQRIGYVTFDMSFA